ncbi:MAG: thiamine-phosphate kinase [Alistipes sp.]|jgi:thiamine-monophosphate kinase|nr:thiamine-phosphate kinase [Alistipes sp.]
MGEFEFIDSIRRSFATIGDPAITGIGDDCAVLPLPGNPESLVVTTDMLIEGVHFLRPAITARELGAKSLAVNLSDIAAMGARPVASFLSIALPKECQGEWARKFMDGYRELSERHNVKLAGGDTTSSHGGVAINVTAIGRAPAANLKYRSGAQPGDLIVVTAPLGSSAAGLRDILSGRFDTALATIHNNPEPQVEQGIWLGRRPEINSMLDLSDGLASDLLHILKASGVGAEIDLETIPTSVSLDLALAGGEDYKLLFTVSPDAFPLLAKDYLQKFATPLYSIGRITGLRSNPQVAPPGKAGACSAETPKILWLQNGRPVKKNWHGFTHF